MAELQSLVEAIASAVDEPSAEGNHQHLAYLLAERAERLATIHRNRLRVCFVLLWPPAALCWLAPMLRGAMAPVGFGAGWLVLFATWLAGERWLVRPLAYQWQPHGAIVHNRERKARIEARLRRSNAEHSECEPSNGAK